MRFYITEYHHFILDTERMFVLLLISTKDRFILQFLGSTRVVTVTFEFHLNNTAEMEILP